MASHRSAAVLWRLDGFRPGRPEVTTPAHVSLERPSLRVHETTQWDRTDVVMREHIPTTGIARTLLDLAAVVGYVKLRQAVDDALPRKTRP